MIGLIVFFYEVIMKAKQNLTEFKYTDNRFEAFVNEVIDGNVLLLVGQRFEANRSVFTTDFYGYLLDELNQEYGTDAKDFSEFVSDNSFLQKCQDYDGARYLRSKLVYMIQSNEYESSDVNPDLMHLIETGYFRFVFTITFDPLVEVAMKKHFGNIRVMNFFDTANRNINNSDDFRIPTVYYLFGKAEDNRMFVATDNDALNALHKWHALMSESALLRYVSEKYILTLGCDYDDWLFRFIWFLLKGSNCSREILSRGLVADYSKSESLDMYLRRNNILVNNDSSEISRSLLKKLNGYNKEKQWENPQMGADVFISYSRKDSKVAESLYKSLTSKGLRVWYDKYDLGGRHGGRFLDLIRGSIETSMMFVAILTPTISEQAKEPHIYRREWEWAKYLKHGLVAGGNCYAVISSDYDIGNKKYATEDDVEWLAELDNYVFDSQNIQFDDFADRISERVFNRKTK